MCSIKNPFCMGYLDYYEDELRSYIVLEFAAGGDLFTKITHYQDADGQCIGLTENLSKLYTYQIMKALEYLHLRGITHRDIKPENILLLEKMDLTIIKLCDFGLAKIMYQASTMNSYVGTPSYIAPEIRDTAEAYTSAVDLWSTGVVLFLMLSGYPPFCESYNDMDLEKQIRTGRLLFSPRWKRVSIDAQKLVRCMLTVNCANRITAAEALQHQWFDAGTKELTEDLLTCNSEAEN
ncbi:unnamed protein product, partial [Mesorhabditis belari]|uniref:Protein kinase domain-containing protein n=1 Tax=Mesorhabditis belari TaxID=2138241 RepID=A0AAF3EHI7_9BILA